MNPAPAGLLSNYYSYVCKCTLQNLQSVVFWTMVFFQVGIDNTQENIEVHRIIFAGPHMCKTHSMDEAWWSVRQLELLQQRFHISRVYIGYKEIKKEERNTMKLYVSGAIERKSYLFNTTEHSQILLNTDTRKRRVQQLKWIACFTNWLGRVNSPL